MQWNKSQHVTSSGTKKKVWVPDGNRTFNLQPMRMNNCYWFYKNLNQQGDKDDKLAVHDREVKEPRRRLD